MEKRYQVFVSSTYADLRDERQRVIQTLMEMDCIPSGMELFPAADEEQWEFIKRVIDDCDYYLLIIGGRYGSTTPEGLSYTEKEYDYATKKEIKVIALLHANPEEIPMGKSEVDPELRGRLKAFREKVGTNRLVKFWKAAEELPGMVALSLSKTIKTYPAVGWVKANQASNPQLLNELNELRKRNEKLEHELTQLRKSQVVEVPNLASLDERITVFGTYTVSSGRMGTSGYQTNSYEWELEITWKEIFTLIAPYLVHYISDSAVKNKLAEVMYETLKKGRRSISLNDQVFQTIKIQLQALNLVTVARLSTTGGGMGVFWELTEKGRALLLSLRTIKSKQSKTT